MFFFLQKEGVGNLAQDKKLKTPDKAESFHLRIYYDSLGFTSRYQIQC